MDTDRVVVSPALLRCWAAAVRAHPDRYRLDAYGPVITPARTAGYFATWATDQTNRAPSPALCRRCGHRLTPTDPGQQLHPLCEPHTPWKPWHRPPAGPPEGTP